MQAAIEAVLSGLGHHKAAQQWGVPRSTLRRRLLDEKTKKDFDSERQKLSTATETNVAQWIIRQEALGYAPTHRNVRFVCIRLLQLQSPDTATPKLGKNWIAGFLRRNPAVKTKIGRRLDYKQVNAATPANINSFFNRREDFAWILPENTWNADEAGIMEGQGYVSFSIGPCSFINQPIVSTALLWVVRLITALT